MNSSIRENTVTEEKIGYRQVFSQKEYCKIIFANLISRFGDSIDAIAFTWLVYAATKSASWAAIISACNMLPTIFLQPFAGAAVERRNKKAIMIASDIIRGLVVMALAFCYVTNQINPWVMLVFTLTISSVEAFCMPASTAIIPKILDEKYYEYGMSLNSVGSMVMQLVGTGVAGAIIGMFGVHVAILIDAVTFFGAAIVKMFLKVNEKLEKNNSNEENEIKTATKRYFDDLKGGLSYMKGKKTLINLGMLAFLVNGMLVPINSFLAPLVSDVLGQESELLSVVGVALTVGSIVGSVFYPMISKKIHVDGFVCCVGIVMSVGVSMITVGSLFKENTMLVYIVTAVMTFVIGTCTSLISSLFGVQFMKIVEEEYMARANAIASAVSTAAMPIISFIMSGLVKVISVKELIAASGVFCAIIFVAFHILKIHFSEDEGEVDMEGKYAE